MMFILPRVCSKIASSLRGRWGWNTGHTSGLLFWISWTTRLRCPISTRKEIRRTNMKRFRDVNASVEGAGSKVLAQELEPLFRFGIQLFQEGDLSYALRCFQAYLKQGGSQQKEATNYMHQIGEVAFLAG